MLRHYLTTALRNFWRFKTATIISVLGLSLGLTCVIVAYGAITYFTNGDRQFTNVDRIVAVTQRIWSKEANRDTGARLPGSLGVAKYLRTDLPELSSVASISEIGTMWVSVDGRRYFVDAAGADPQFMQLFDFPFLHSSTKNPLQETGYVVLTEPFARRLFGTADVVGKSFKLENAYEVTVSAVIKTLPKSSHFYTESGHLSAAGGINELCPFELLFSRSTYRAFQAVLKDRNAPGWGVIAGEWGFGTYTYALLPSDGSLTLDSMNDRLRDFAVRHGAFKGNPFAVEYKAVPAGSIRMTALERTTFRNSPGLPLATIVLTLASIVLLMACVSYANLSIAQAVVRSKEASVRRVLGASSSQLATQQLIEAVLLISISAAIAFGIVFATTAAIEIQAHLDLLGAIASNFRFWLWLGATLFFMTTLLGLLPSLWLSRRRPVNALLRRTGVSTKSFTNRAIVATQFSLASVLLVGLVVVYQQNERMRATALSEGSDPIVALNFGWSSNGATVDDWTHELAQVETIKSVSAVAWTPWSEIWAMNQLRRTPDANTVTIISTGVHYNFDTALDMHLLGGRSFERRAKEESVSTASSQSATTEILVDRTLAASLGFVTPESAVNQLVYQPMQSSAKPLRIIGVVENKPLRLMPVFGNAGCAYFLNPGNGSYLGSLVVRISRNSIPQSLAAIDQAWRKLSDAPINRKFLDEQFETAFQTYSLLARIINAITFGALFIALIGLFGVALFVVERRTHEIGVRKTLGASVTRILSMLLMDFSKPVLLANLVAWPVAYMLSQKYLDLFIQRIGLSALPFIVSLVVSVGVAWIVVAGHAWRAARLKPADVLRHE